MLYARDFRARARQALKGKWGVAIGVAFVATLLTGGVSGSASGSASAEGSGYLSFVNHEAFILLTTFMAGCGLIALILGGAVKLGWCRFNIDLVTGKEVHFADLFSQIHRLWTGFVMNLLVGLFVALWSLLLVIPGIIAICVVLALNMIPALEAQLLNADVMTLFSVAMQICAVVLILCIPGVIAQYRYAMVPYLMAEFPELKVMDAIRESKRLMKGNKWRLYCLHFSFIGWMLLNVFSMGIGTLWLTPYMQSAEAVFYMEVTGRSGLTAPTAPEW